MWSVEKDLTLSLMQMSALVSSCGTYDEVRVVDCHVLGFLTHCGEGGGGGGGGGGVQKTQRAGVIIFLWTTS